MQELKAKKKAQLVSDVVQGGRRRLSFRLATSAIVTRVLSRVCRALQVVPLPNS